MDRGNTHFSLFLQNLKFSFPKNWEKLEEIELDLMNFFTKTSKIPLYSLPFILKQGSNSNIVIK